MNQKAVANNKWTTKTNRRIEVDVIVPVHNAAATLRTTIESALHQVGLEQEQKQTTTNAISHVYVCCYDDGSTDNSWGLLSQLAQEHEHEACRQNDTKDETSRYLPSSLLIAKAEDGIQHPHCPHECWKSKILIV